MILDESLDFGGFYSSKQLFDITFQEFYAWEGKRREKQIELGEGIKLEYTIVIHSEHLK